MQSTLKIFSSKHRKRLNNWKPIKVNGIDLEILQGTISQSNVESQDAGTQCTACVMTALGLSVLQNVNTWSPGTVDNIIKIGTHRHEVCEEKDRRGFADPSSFVKYSGIPGYNQKIVVKEEGLKDGLMNQAIFEYPDGTTAVGAISEFLERNWHCVVTLNGFSVGLIKEAEHCFVFNSHPCNDAGQPDPNGTGCVIKIPNAIGPEVVEFLVSSNYGPTFKSLNNNTNYVYSIVAMSVSILNDQNEEFSPPKRLRPESNTLAKEKGGSESSDSDFDTRKTKKVSLASAKFVKAKIQPGFRVYKVSSLPTRYDQLLAWLERLNLSLISTVCISKDLIQNNLVAVYHAGEMKSVNDFYWRKDGCSWKSGPHIYLPKNDPIFKVTYHYLRPGNQTISYKRTEISAFNVKDGKYDWEALKTHKWPVVVVHYEGTGDLNNFQCLPHGNRKFTPQKASTKHMTELITNTPTTPEIDEGRILPPHEPKSSLLRPSLKRKLQFSTPYQAFTGQRAEAATKDPHEASLLRPRNVEQVKSVKSQMKKEASFNDPVKLLVHHSILHKELLPICAIKNGYLHILATLPQLDHHFQDLLKLRKKIILHYDTTFKCGKYFLSILLFRHEFLQDSPVIPLKFLFHENKSTFAHELLFENLIETFPGLTNAEVVLVSDREMSFKKLKRRHLPSALHIFCHLHIYNNVEEWLKSHGQISFSKKYCADVRQLLHSQTEADFKNNFDSFGESWSVTFQRYFQSRLMDDVRASAKFAVQDWILFDNMSGVTNNASESINAAFKKWLEVPRSMYEGVLRSYFYQIAKYEDIKDAFSRRDGKFRLKDDHQTTNLIFEPTNDVISELGLNMIFTEGKYSNNVTRFKPENVEIRSTVGLAWLFVRNGRISYVDQDCFVKGLNRRSFHVDPNRKFCSCLRAGCSHLQAVFIQQRRKTPNNWGADSLTKAKMIYRPLPRAGKKLSDKIRKRARFRVSAERKNVILQKAKSVALRKQAIASSFSNLPQRIATGNRNVKPTAKKAKKLLDLKSNFDNIANEPISLKDTIKVQHVLEPTISSAKPVELPLLSSVNMHDTVLKIQNQSLTLVDLKTVEIELKLKIEEVKKRPFENMIRLIKRAA